MQVLVDDDLGRLTLRRLRPWHGMLARLQAARLDRELASGARPEASALLAARAIRLTSEPYRRDLAANLHRILAAARLSRMAPQAGRVFSGPARRPWIPVRGARIRCSAPGLAELAARLAEPGPVPARGVALVSELLADGAGPLYREACRDDLESLVGRAATVLAGR